ncbi:hypothetical protein FSP39_022517 [Pinctada imbricata]|uniref:Large subunit GTPase 1 homolog n=1 Tax=Pinctada imbricata TaxID=66713 RepID=A0AA89C1U0_PINIB|nr:hypothetical protein FSP39_022517 [Pinctada imbricata]
MNTKLYNKLKPRPKLTECVKLKGAGKDSIFDGRMAEKVRLQIGNFSQTHDIVVCDISDDLLLGLDFLQDHDTVIDLKSYMVSFGEEKIPIKQINDTKSTKHVNIYKISIQKRTVIPPNTMKFIKLKTDIPSHEPLAIQPRNIHQELFCPNSVVSPINPYVAIRNLSSRYLTLKKNVDIGVGIGVDEIINFEDDQEIDERKDTVFNINKLGQEDKTESTKKSNMNVLPDYLTDLYERATSKLTKEESHEVQNLLSKFQHVFAANDFDIGQFNGNIKHKIDTKDAQPIKQKLRRTPMGFEDEEEKHIQQMLERGIIQPSSSEWASPPVLIRKKDGSLRFCIDFRALNKVTTKDAFPIPNLKDCIDTLRGSIYFSSLDMAWGYWQIPMDEKDRHKTAFVTKYGLFEHVRLPFGLCNSPATFSRVIQLVLQGLTWRECLAYLDDVIVIGADFQSHVQNLQTVMSRFEKYNLKLKPKKCNLFQTEIKFLGKILHTSEVNDGYDWGRLNLQSVTEQSNLDDFLTTAELAGTEFTAEKLNIRFVDPKKNSGLLSEDEKVRISRLHEEHQDLLRIPRRPPWDETTSPDDLDKNEKEAFLLWRKGLASIQEVEGLVMTPYEKNLDFWRQLWRVIERSDVIVQVVDARNPLLFRCEDVEKYVKEVDDGKLNLLLINKADFLSEEQREQWCSFFDSIGVNIIFWSALQETERQAQEAKESQETETAGIDVDEESDDSGLLEEDEEGQDFDDLIDDQIDDDEKDMDVEKTNKTGDDKDIDIDDDKVSHDESVQVAGERLKTISVSEDDNDRGNSEGVVKGNSEDISVCSSSPDKDSSLCCKNTIEEDEGCSKAKSSKRDENDSMAKDSRDRTSVSETEEFCDKYGAPSKEVSRDGKTGDGGKFNNGCVKNSPNILSGPELIDFLKEVHSGEKVQEGQTTIGMVGYPNVGKSSTINSILKMKKVPVSATPGRTKHFQTLYVDSDLMLCDCPGLVFPSFVSTKAELIINGILPIDQMRDHVPPVSLVCNYIPRVTLEAIYGINIPPPLEGEDPSRDPTADEFLNAYGHMRGFMTANGLPDCPRSARYILKDFVNGRLLYCNAPPGVDPREFNSTSVLSSRTVLKEKQQKTSKERKPVKQNRIDREFFRKTESSIHSKGVKGVPKFVRSEGLQQIGQSPYGTPCSSMQSLTGKPWKKHNNRRKKEKLRRIYKEHDEDHD